MGRAGQAGKCLFIGGSMCSECSAQQKGGLRHPHCRDTQGLRQPNPVSLPPGGPPSLRWTPQASPRFLLPILRVRKSAGQGGAHRRWEFLYLRQGGDAVILGCQACSRHPLNKLSETERKFWISHTPALQLIFLYFDPNR